MKILFTGAQGTGKTTVLNRLKEYPAFQDYEFIGSISRMIQEKYGVDLKGGESTNMFYQTLIFDTYCDLFCKHDNLIADRSLIDVLAYTLCSEIDPVVPISQEMYRMYRNLCKFETMFKQEILYIYFPIEFEIENDGIRSLNVEFQHKIDEAIKTTLFKDETIADRIITVHGTVDERIKTIFDALHHFSSK